MPFKFLIGKSSETKQPTLEELLELDTKAIRNRIHGLSTDARLKIVQAARKRIQEGRIGGKVTKKSLRKFGGTQTIEKLVVIANACGE
ncbi:hypothetical protein COU76_01150 [Candidatus Peregrinibacteria bacterium CG10_big_fil_rev_8_21_14_0_10_49_10]|nr:MAG: hypothetical protein COU76_01150 [Candidatus Peregrinibacteria bacterium CG10_big_fil_rev_8_21_14_0_10_49_10]